MVKAELGSKHLCENCGIRFFDFNKDPITCPKCGTIVTLAPLLRSGRTGSSLDEALGETDPRFISLEDVETEEKIQGSPDVDLELDDVSETDAFLEDDEDLEDDVAGFIDGDIEEEEN